MSSIIKLKSSDGEIFDVEEKVARMSATINTLLQDLGVVEGDKEPVPLPNVTGTILKLVLKWAEHHKDDAKIAEDNDDRNEYGPTEIPAWDEDFLKLEQSTLFEIILAANYLDIKELLDMACQIVANMIKGKTPEEIRKHFNIENDFNPKEEEEIRKENEWLEEK